MDMTLLHSLRAVCRSEWQMPQYSTAISTSSGPSGPGVYWNGSSSAEADARIARLEQALIEQLGALQAVSQDAQQVEQFNAQRDELLNAMRAIKAQVAPVIGQEQRGGDRQVEQDIERDNDR